MECVGLRPPTLDQTANQWDVQLESGNPRHLPETSNVNKAKQSLIVWNDNRLPPHLQQPCRLHPQLTLDIMIVTLKIYIYIYINTNDIIYRISCTNDVGGYVITLQSM
jgi:hypothetical protein